MKLQVVLLVFFSLLLEPSWTLQRGYLYPHGRSVPDQILPPQDDVSSPEVYLRIPIVFFNEVYNSIFINSNGLLSFTTEVSRFYNLQFPLDYPVIAPLYSNVDVRASGAVYYRETQEDIVLDRATRTITAAFSNAREFKAKSVLIVTWEDVGYHNQGADKVNTYQAVVISDGEDSYVELLYPDHAIQWVQGASQGGGLPDALAQAGFIAGDGRLFTLKGSGSDQVRNLNEWSNADNPGQWLFHVGRIGDGNVDQPDIIETEDDSSSAFCSSGLRTCHSRAACVDFETGFCCVCQNGYFGNGKNCLSEDIPLRVNGKISGIVNGFSLTDLDLQTYIVPADGRTYTAISIVPPSVGFDMQNLNILGSTIGWLFARPVKGALNGYQLTGGVFNQTVTVKFPQTGHQLTLTQQFTGLDVFQQLTMKGTLEGSLPSVPVGSKIIIKDYEEQYTRVGLGQLIAQSSQVYQLEGVGVDNSYSVEQTVTFEECAGTVPAASTMRLKVIRVYIGYQDVEGIIRYAMTSKVTPLGVDEDPCRDTVARCGSHSTCVVNGDSYRCVCNPGYQMGYIEESSDVSCVDIDECATGSSNCDRYATCTNTQGSFHCQCNPGYTEEGANCIKVLTCEDARCDVNADCVQRSRNAPQCVCRSGFNGDGTTCTPVNNVWDYGETSPPQERPHVVSPTCVLITCTCPDGYDIDYSETRCTLRQESQQPSEPSQPTNENDDERSLVDENFDDLQTPEPICISDNMCSCPKGYVYLEKNHECLVNSTTFLETKGPTGQKRSCVVEGLRCHSYATCVMYTKSRSVACECNEGYRGDGERSCDPVEGYDTPQDECISPADCIGEADCLEDASTRRRVCSCYSGFTKNPVTNTCHRSEIEEPQTTCLTANICHPDAKCVQDYESEELVCRCNSGYEGDGRSCKPIEPGCNVLYNCAPSTADCLYDEVARGYRCKCRQGYQGDGQVCTLTKTCRDDPSLCGEHASCQPSPDGDYSCLCEHGFVGNGLLCKPVSAKIGNFLLVGQGMAILRVPFQPTSTDRGRPIVMQPTQQAIGIDLDCSENKVYWSDITGGNIYSSDYTGQNLQTFIGSDIGSAEGISIDWLSRNIFWTDSARDTIEVASLDNSSIRKTIIGSGLVNPRGIAVHPSRGKVFWADWNRVSPKIEWANLDGSGRSVFVQGPRVKLPNSLALDFSTDELCWADAATFSIECIGIGNHYERTVASNLTYPFGLAISQDHYYWTDWISQKIERVTRPGQVQEKSLPPPLGSSGKLYGIVAISDSCPRLSNVCQNDRGRCPEHHLCLLNGNGGRNCVCASPVCQSLGS